MEAGTFKSKVKRFFRRLLFILVLLAIGLFCLAYWGTYSSGVRSGIIVKVSKKGVLFKTYEGQLNLETFGALRSQSLVGEAFEFSVAHDRKDVIKALEEASLSGERVSVHYVQRFFTFPWRGDTPYFVVSVERLHPGQPDSLNSSEHQ